MLSRFESRLNRWVAIYYEAPDPRVVKSDRVSLTKLWRWRFWHWHMILFYQKKADAIFYPGFDWFDTWSIRMRRMLGRKVPIIATLEGLAGDSEREKYFSDVAGHPVHCGRVSSKVLRNIDWSLSEADHVIAISPFLAKMGTSIYGDKFSVLPLGVDDAVFHSRGRKSSSRFEVVGSGTVYERKRPWIFLEMAGKFPEANFTWYGDGELRAKLLKDITRLGLDNVSFPGALPNAEIADQLRSADLLVLPSHSEGVPKVSQEAAACGVAVVLYGFYESPSVVDGENGYVVWSDEECFSRVGELIDSPEKAESMGAQGVRMSMDWGWDSVAVRWEDAVLDFVSKGK